MLSLVMVHLWTNEKSQTDLNLALVALNITIYAITKEWEIINVEIVQK
jgi:hypothetical protein